MSADVTAWEYRYADVKTHEDQGHDTKVAPSADTAEKMAPASMVAGEKVRQERAGRMPRGLEEAGKSRSTLDPGTPGLLLTLDDILKLPKHELVTEFKCIEGWSQIVHWGGVRLADLIAAYPPEKGPDGGCRAMSTWRRRTATTMSAMIWTLPASAKFAGDRDGWQTADARARRAAATAHANQVWLQANQTDRLIAYTDQKPDDYWTKLGYDWYAGL